MARNRMIKPKFWDDAKIGRISRDARLLYIGMWNFCDDLGVIRADSVWIKSKIFPFDQMQIQQFDKICQEILRNGFISLFSYKDEEFYYLPKFSLHQKINKPNYEEVNVPKEILHKSIDKITEQSRNNHGLITEQSIPKIEVEEEVETSSPYNPPKGDETLSRTIVVKEQELEQKAAELAAKEQEILKLEASLRAKSKKELPDISFVSDDFKDIFVSWLEYKRERRESYKSEKPLKACYMKLLELSNNDPETARMVVNQSMASNWSGLFEIKNGRAKTPFNATDRKSDTTTPKDYSERF